MRRKLSACPGLPETINYRTHLYSLAAAAAGVSILALAQPAEAEVVVTRRSLPILQQGPLLLDVNNDGIADFQFSLRTYRGSSLRAFLNVQALTTGAVVASQKGGGFDYGAYGYALTRGAKIGPSAHFSSGNGFGSGYVTIEESFGPASHSRREYGNWGGNQRNRFLGVKFQIHGATHYGWIRLTVVTATNAVMSGTITGYAYETIPDKRIVAGIPPTAEIQVQEVLKPGVAKPEAPKPRGASLGTLALGADGLSLWRRKETGQSAH